MPDDSATDTVTAPRPRFQRLRDRLAGRPVDTTLRRDIPEPLVPVLRHWNRLASQHDSDAPQRVALRLGLSPVPGGRGQFSFLDALCNVSTDPDLLDVVDAMLAVHRAPDWFDDYRLSEIAEKYTALILSLDDALEDAGSAYTLAQGCRALAERVDPTVVDAVEKTIDAAPPTAGGLLRDAWRQIYGLHPDPTTGYRDALRAVEEVACPLVLPDDGAATLGKVIAHLRQGGHKWAFALVDRDGADTVDPLVAMLDRLWTGQVSRHGGGQNSRDQTAAEAQAAVHLAATLVQLLGAGALTHARATQPAPWPRSPLTPACRARPGSPRTCCATPRSPSRWTPASRCTRCRTSPATATPARPDATTAPAAASTGTPPTPSPPT